MIMLKGTGGSALFAAVTRSVPGTNVMSKFGELTPPAKILKLPGEPAGAFVVKLSMPESALGPSPPGNGPKLALNTGAGVPSTCVSLLAVMVSGAGVIVPVAFTRVSV